MNIELQPFLTPNYVYAEIPAKHQAAGFNPESTTKWLLRDLDAETLSGLCDEFRDQIFRKAEKLDPKK